MLVRPAVALPRLAVLRHYEEEALQLHLQAFWTKRAGRKGEQLMSLEAEPCKRCPKEDMPESPESSIASDLTCPW